MNEETDDILAEIERKIIKRVYLWLLAGGIGFGGIIGSGSLRPDPFTGTDG